MPDRDDQLLWWIGDDDRKVGPRLMWVTIVLFASPGVVLLFAGASGPGSGIVWLVMVAFLVLGIVLGVWFRARDQRAISSIKFAPGARPVTFTVRRINDREDTYPVAAVRSVRVIRTDGTPETVRLRLFIDGTKQHTRSGPAGTAEAMLGLFAEAGALITTKTLTPD